MSEIPLIIRHSDKFSHGLPYTFVKIAEKPVTNPLQAFQRTSLRLSENL